MLYCLVKREVFSMEIDDVDCDVPVEALFLPEEAPITPSAPSYWEIAGEILHSIALHLEKAIYASSDAILRNLVTPIRPGEDGNYCSPLLERIHRCASTVFHLMLTPLTMSLFALGEGLHLLGDLMTGNPYIYFQGQGKETADPNHFCILTLNACMLWGGLPRPLGGVTSPDDRVEKMAEKIKETEADIVLMQEMAYGPSVDLFQELKDEFPHCITRIGPNAFRMESGLCIFSKFPILSVKFLPFPDQNGMKRGAVFIETPNHYFINTHMEAGDSEQDFEMRAEQFELISKEIARLKEQKNKPCFFGGDFNADRFENNNEYNALLGNHEGFHDPYYQLHPTIDEHSASQTNLLLSHMLGKKECERPYEMDDYILLHGNPDEFELNPELVDTFSLENPFSSLSDHKGLLLEVRRISSKN